MFVDQRKEVDAVPAGGGGKGKVVDPGDVGLDLAGGRGRGTSRYSSTSRASRDCVPKTSWQQPKALISGLGGVKGRGAEGHRVGVIDHPGVGQCSMIWCA